MIDRDFILWIVVGFIVWIAICATVAMMLGAG